MRANTTCRSCHAPVRWVLTAHGKRMPIDPEPVSDGNVWIDHYEAGTPVVEVALSGDGVPAAAAERFQSHFVSCPQRDEWRKR